MNFKEHIMEKAKNLKRTISLPEATDPRILRAAIEIQKQSIASSVFLVGKKQSIENAAKELSLDISKCDIIDPETDNKKDDYIKSFYEMRKEKGLTLEQAKEFMKDPLFYATMMAKKGDCYAILAGAIHKTSDVLRAGLTIIKTQKGVKTASSYFIMDTHGKEFGHEGLMIFSDCGMIPDPTSEQLAEIAIASAQSFKTLIGAEPRVAMLSFSSKGSATSPSTQKVIDATKIALEKVPNLKLDGELQLDAALIPEVASSKAPQSTVAGKANVLIFPNLDAGNIGYKLVNRFAKADAFGPLLQGFAAPISDLSRGCSVEEVIVTASLLLTQERG